MIDRLFIGGAQDGKQLPVLETERTVDCPVISSRSVASVLATCIEKALGVEEETYHLRQIKGEHQTFFVFVLEGTSSDDVIQMLIEGYRCQNQS